MSRRHRSRLLPDGRSMCNAERCAFTGTSEEVTYHVKFGITKSKDGSWCGPANVTGASLADVLGQLMPSRA